MRLLEIREDPLAHFLPTRNTQHGTFFSAAPPGLAPELADATLQLLKLVANEGQLAIGVRRGDGGGEVRVVLSVNSIALGGDKGVVVGWVCGALLDEVLLDGDHAPLERADVVDGPSEGQD